MKQFNAERIRNIVLLGHGSSGKSTLAEAMLYRAGTVKRLGDIASGNTVCDFDPEETHRRMSVFAKIAPLEWKDCKINIIDTPGKPDFEGEMLEGIRAADCAVITVSGKSGVKAGTQNAWEKAKALNMPTAFFVGKLDEEQADFYKVLEGLKSAFGAPVCPVIVPFFTDGTPVYINLITMKSFRYVNGKPQDAPMPETGHRLAGLITAVSEAVAETSDEYFDKYFSGEPFTKDELTNGVLNGIRQGAISPVFCGSAFTGSGIDMLLDAAVSYFPGADTGTAAKAPDGKNVTLCASDSEPLAAFVFKTVADPYVGKLSYIRVYSGTLSADSAAVNSSTGERERIGKICGVFGKKQTETTCITAGDIGAVAKMATLKTGDTLYDSSRAAVLPPIDFPHPVISMAVTPLKKGDEEKISLGFHKLTQEDKTIEFKTDGQTKQQILSGLGELHIDVTVSKLKSKFGCEVQLSVPKVAYKETIKKKVKCEGKYKKQTGGHGQYGDVVIEFEPCESEEMVFEENVFGGSVPRNYFPAVEKGLRESVCHGVIAGYPVVHLKATLLDGSYHPVDSSEMAFKTAAAMAYREALPKAMPTLLEPIGKLDASISENVLGDVIGEINKRRGRILGIEHLNGEEIVKAEAPMSEMHDFSTALRSITQGRGSFTFEFERYEEAPEQTVQSVKNSSEAATAG